MIVIIQEKDGTIHELKMENGRWTLPSNPDWKVMRVIQEGDKFTVQYRTGKQMERFFYGERMTEKKE